MQQWFINILVIRKNVTRIYYVFAIFNGFMLQNKPESKVDSLKITCNIIPRLQQLLFLIIHNGSTALNIFYFLFYPIILEGHRGTTDEFATIPLHLVLFSAALVELAKFILVHSLILSSHLFFCLLFFSFSFPCAL